MIWSEQQSAIFEFVEKDSRSLVIEAVAGSGKTSTIVESAKRLDPFTSAVFLAFNKRVADTLKSKLPAHVPALTLNALGHRAWKGFNGHYVEVDAYRVNALVREMSDDSNVEFRSGVTKLVGLAKSVGLVPQYALEAFDGRICGLVEDSDDVWSDLIDEYNVDFGWGGQNKHARALDLARKVLTRSIHTGGQKIDFNDQLYLPIIFGADWTKYELIFVDEAQDCSSINLEIVERSLAKNGRVIAVGDAAQAIYHFRGAGSNAMPDIVRRFQAVELPLHTSYRCPKSVVRAAQAYVPHIQARADAEEGSVGAMLDWNADSFVREDVVLCRFNAPLIKLAFQLIRARKACKVLGRDIGGGLVALVAKLKAVNVRDLRGKLAAYVDKEAARLHREGKPQAIGALLDRVECLRVFMSELGDEADTSVLKQSIESLFSDEQNGSLTLSTIHKFKGAEADRIFWLNPNKASAYDAGNEEQVRNLKYVATTRSKKSLHYIEAQ